MANVAGNAAIGGVVAGLRSLVTGRNSLSTVAWGAFGGALQGAGKQVAGARFFGAGLLGREVAAIGVSVTYSAGRDSAVILFPLWPIMLELHPGSARHARVHVNLFELATIGTALADRHTSLDLEATASQGALVFRRPRTRMPLGYDEDGFTQVSTIFIANELSGGAKRLTILAHETVHVLQWDAYAELLALPVERNLVRRLPGSTVFTRYVDLGLIAPMFVYVIAKQIPYYQQPWENEAYVLTIGRTRP